MTRQWATESDELSGIAGRKIRILKSDVRLTFDAVIALLKTSADFRTLFNDTLTRVPSKHFVGKRRL